MTKPKETNQLTFTEKYITAIQNIKGITKDGVNPHFKSKYITLDNINNAVNPVLNEQGLYITHSAKDNILTTKVTDGQESITTEWQLNVAGTTAQQRGSELTYAKRYNISCLLNLAVDDDDDGNVASSVKPKEIDVNSRVEQALNIVKTDFTNPKIQNVIEYIRQNGNTKQVEQLETELKNKNQEIEEI